MRTLAPIMVVFVLAAAGAMFQASGAAAVWGAEPPQTQAAQQALNDSADQANPGDGSIRGPVSSSSSDVVGLIANGLGSITDFAASVVLLPVTLINLFFPVWFAETVGTVGYLLAGIGVIQWATNREWR